VSGKLFVFRSFPLLFRFSGAISRLLAAFAAAALLALR